MIDDVLLEFAQSANSDLGRLLTGAALTVKGQLMSRLAEMGHPDIRSSHVAVFAGLEPGGTQISTLAHRAGHSRQAMSALVREVEKLGYVHTSPDPADGRATLVSLTDRGVAFCRSVIEVSRQLTEEFEARVGADQLAALRAQLATIADGDG